jgi:pimeloyl-ACP methyl ester carboxylesterase
MSPVTPGAVTVREHATDVEELLDERGVDRPVVVGLSMGGLVAMELVTANPERYAGIGLVTTTAEPVTPRSGRLA